MKPIIFNTEMVRAILDGRKTQTRRPVNPQPRWVACPNVPFKTDDADPKGIINAPYQFGDVLYVRETFADEAGGTRRYLGDHLCYKADDIHLASIDAWTPSIHMPKWAARIFLKVKAVRVERVQDISEADAWAEGCHLTNSGEAGGVEPDPIGWFNHIWQSIYGNVDENPWVWVIEFERIDKP